MNREYTSIMMTSRNKDNKHLDGFKQRTKIFLIEGATDFPENKAKIENEFEQFVNEGYDGEMCRCYKSVNTRNGDIVHRKLLHYLIDHPEVDHTKIENLVSKIAGERSSAKTHKWMFDYDDDLELLPEFIKDVAEESGLTPTVTYTVTGASVIVDHGFNTKNLLSKWENVTLNMDAMLLLDYQTNHDAAENM